MDLNLTGRPRDRPTFIEQCKEPSPRSGLTPPLPLGLDQALINEHLPNCGMRPTDRLGGRVHRAGLDEHIGHLNRINATHARSQWTQRLPHRPQDRIHPWLRQPQC
ncbi:hypothetical protein, partial [Mycolicibacterium mucogenicum]|uniref:hypothetical protein n=1 Tax=Mycolicibacterium mucogenicum TaxID=56689 RepID=UPI001950CC24